jgi:hypothetical protein
MGYNQGPPFTLQQKRILAILPKVSGTLSCFFSGVIIYTILRDKKRRSRTYHRLIFGISCCDLSASFWLALSTWPIPEDGALWAVGNETTCNLQGFFTQLGIASSFYNASLSFYYVLVVRYGWKEHQLKWAERFFFHSIPLLWGLVSAITGLSIGVYGNASLWCWVSPLYQKFRWTAFYGPLWVMILIVTINSLLVFDHVRKTEIAAQRYRFEDVSSQFPSSYIMNPPDEVPQRRNSRLSWSSIGSGGIWKQAGDVSGQQPQAPDPQAQRSYGKRKLRKRILRRSRRTREVANQSFMYAGAFYFNWAALTVRTNAICCQTFIPSLGHLSDTHLLANAQLISKATRIIQQVNGRIYFPILVIAAIAVPLQGEQHWVVNSMPSCHIEATHFYFFLGLPNFLVYLAPRFKQLRDERLWPWIRNSLSQNRSSEGSDLSNGGMSALRLSQIIPTAHDSANKAVLDNTLRDLNEEMEDEEEEMEVDDEKEEKQIEADVDEEANHNDASHAHDLVEIGVVVTDGPQTKAKWIDATVD